MDTTQDPKKKRKRLELGWAKSSQDNTIESTRRNEIKLDGKVFRMAKDLATLPEIDYEDPQVKEWLKHEDSKFRKRHPHLTYREADKQINQNISKLRKSE